MQSDKGTEYKAFVITWGRVGRKLKAESIRGRRPTGVGTPAKPRADVSSYWACHWLHDFFFLLNLPQLILLKRAHGRVSQSI